MDEVRTLLVARDPLARSGLAFRLAREEGIRVAGEAGADEDLNAAFAAVRADVLLCDLGDPFSIRDLDPVLALVRDEGGAQEALSQGARGVLLRTASGERLASALRALRSGLVVLDDALAASLTRERQPSAGVDAETLTPRELEVLGLLALGLANKEIAHRLEISEHTAKFHVNAILAKLGAQSRVQAVVRAVQLGLVSL